MCKPGGEFIAIIVRYKLIMAQSYVLLQGMQGTLNDDKWKHLVAK